VETANAVAPFCRGKLTADGEEENYLLRQGQLELAGRRVVNQYACCFTGTLDTLRGFN